MLKPELEINENDLFMRDIPAPVKTTDKDLSAIMQIKIGNERSMINIMRLALHTVFHEMDMSDTLFTLIAWQ